MLAPIHEREIAMSTVAFNIPENVRAMYEGLRAFAKAEVLTLQERTERVVRGSTPNLSGGQPVPIRQVKIVSERGVLLIYH